MGSVPSSPVASSSRPESSADAPPTNLHASFPPTIPYTPLVSVPELENIRSSVSVPTDITPTSVCLISAATFFK